MKTRISADQAKLMADKIKDFIKVFDEKHLVNNDQFKDSFDTLTAVKQHIMGNVTPNLGLVGVYNKYVERAKLFFNIQDEKDLPANKREFIAKFKAIIEEQNIQINKCFYLILDYLGTLEIPLTKKYPEVAGNLSHYTYFIPTIDELIEAGSDPDVLEKYNRYVKKGVSSPNDILTFDKWIADPHDPGVLEKFRRNVFKKIEKSVSHPIDKVTLNKYKIMVEAVDFLRKNDLQGYCQHLKNNKTQLTVRRDRPFMTFVKALGVIGATIFGLGYGGYKTYEQFFGKKSTTGKNYIRQVEKLTHAKLKSKSK